MTRKKLTPFDICLYLFLLALSVVFLFPIYYILIAAFSDPLEVIKNPIMLLPKGLTLYNFNMLLDSPTIWLGYRNTIVYMAVGTALNVAVTLITAYALAQKDLPARGFFMFVIVFTMFFSGGIIPQFLVVKGLGLLNSMWAIILPGAVSTWNLMITRTYIMQQIPPDLGEAASIDGAGEYRIFAQIILPLVMPIIVVITLFYASTHWNSWFSAMIYIRERNLYPLQIFLRELLIEDMTSGMLTEAESDRMLYMVTLKYAVMTVAILPLMVIFPFVQKHFVKGVMIGALKG